MKDMVRRIREARAEMLGRKQKPVTNFMDGTSYQWNALDTLRMVTASSIFGEPAYYRDGEFKEMTVLDGKMRIDEHFRKYVLPTMAGFDGMTTTQIMEKAIDDALSCDFRATLEWAVTLREEYFMRLNPQVIMVRAAIHPLRAAFTRENPGLFGEIEAKVMRRADEPASQLTYYLFRKGSKRNLPNLLKRSWAKRYEAMSRYDIFKYRNSAVGMIDTIRVCHAKGELIDELMRTGTVAMEESEKTWETLRSSGVSWSEILDTIRIGHMALLRNLRGIFTEIEDRDRAKAILEKLKAGVRDGMQFPFRYYSAYQAVKEAGEMIHHRRMIMDALEECIDIACDNMPRLPGRTMCLSDNSGSAWGGITSEYGTTTVAVIDNLSSVIAARNSEEGEVGKFGDKLIRFDISKRDGVLRQAVEISAERDRDVGGATENGIWLFFSQAIEKKEVYDNIFIYSDQQAGHGGLYGTHEGIQRYTAAGYASPRRMGYVDVAKLIADYRRKVNPRVNVFSVQTAGYNNVLVPESGYRTTLLYGWTGKELVYADAVNRFWDAKDAQWQ